MCSLENGNNEKHQLLFDCLAKNHSDEMATFSGELSLPVDTHSDHPLEGLPGFPHSPSVCQQNKFSTICGPGTGDSMEERKPTTTEKLIIIIL